MTGILLIDYGATFHNLDGVVGESLIFENIDPRMMYHEGLLMCLFAFIIALFINGLYLDNEIKKR